MELVCGWSWCLDGAGVWVELVSGWRPGRGPVDSRQPRLHPARLHFLLFGGYCGFYLLPTSCADVASVTTTVGWGSSERPFESRWITVDPVRIVVRGLVLGGWCVGGWC